MKVAVIANLPAIRDMDIQAAQWSKKSKPVNDARKYPKSIRIAFYLAARSVRLQEIFEYRFKFDGQISIDMITKPKA